MFGLIGIGAGGGGAGRTMGAVWGLLGPPRSKGLIELWLAEVKVIVLARRTATKSHLLIVKIIGLKHGF